MRLLWTLVKVAIALAIAIPLCIIVLGTALGILGALFGLAILVLRVAVIGLIGYGLFRLGARLLRGPAPAPRAEPYKTLPTVDPHYEEAMRELDRELGETPRR